MSDDKRALPTVADFGTMTRSFPTATVADFLSWSPCWLLDGRVDQLHALRADLAAWMEWAERDVLVESDYLHGQHSGAYLGAARYRWGKMREALIALRAELTALRRKLACGCTDPSCGLRDAVGDEPEGAGEP